MTAERWSTHAVDLGATTVTKRFLPQDGDRHAREWRALTLLAEHAPGLAPTPLHGGTEDGRPTVVMSRLPGAPLRGVRMGARETAALA